MIPAIVNVIASSILMSLGPLYCYSIANQYGIGMNVDSVNISSMPNDTQSFDVAFYYGGAFSGSSNEINLLYSFDESDSPDVVEYLTSSSRGLDFYIREQLLFEWHGERNLSNDQFDVTYQVSVFPISEYNDGSKNLKLDAWASSQLPAIITNTFLGGYLNCSQFSHRSSNIDGKTSYFNTDHPIQFINFDKSSNSWRGGVFSLNGIIDLLPDNTYFSINGFTFIYYDDVVNSQFNDGYNSGYDAGFGDGYNQGMTEGLDRNNNLFSLINSAFAGVTSFFNFELLPGLTLGTLLMIPLGLGVIYLIIRLISA